MKKAVQIVGCLTLQFALDFVMRDKLGLTPSDAVLNTETCLIFLKSLIKH